jgi:hypothetical protein
MKKRYNGEDNSYITSEDSNSGMKEAYDVGQAEMRINNAKERMRAEAEGARDEGKIIESGDQGFGGPGSSRILKATPKPATKPATKPAVKPAAKPAAKETARDTGSDVARMANRGNSAEAPVDETSLSLSERMKLSRERARSGKGSTNDTRSVGERLKSAFGMKSGGSVSSASKRADGCAIRGKTRA